MDINQVATVFRELDPLDRLRLGVCAPAPWLSTGDDNLRVTSFGTVALVELVIAIRWLTLSGEVLPFAFRHVPASNGSAVQTIHRLSDGWLLTATVQVASGTVPDPGIFVRLDIVRGLTGALQLVGTLAQGSVSSRAAISYPLTPITGAGAASGQLTAVVVANPAAGANWIATVPANTRWRVQSVLATFATDATAANRETRLLIDDGANVFANVPSGVTQIAAQTRDYTWFAAAVRGAGATALDVIAPMPAVELSAGARILGNALNIQAGDQWASPVVYVEAFA